MHRYVGQNSIPALLRDQPSPIETKDGIDIRRDMRPIFGLDTSAPFPLMSAKHLDMMTQDIFTELPPDREVMMYVFISQFTILFGRLLRADAATIVCSTPTRKSHTLFGASSRILTISSLVSSFISRREPRVARIRASLAGLSRPHGWPFCSL